MAYEYKEYMETPTASINITDTASTDVTNYATAQVVDSNLVSENILSGVSILGVNGSLESNKLIIITSNDTTVTTTKTKGVAPYNTAYYYTNITVNNHDESELINGLTLLIICDSSLCVSSSSYRNARIRFGETGVWYPMMEGGEMVNYKRLASDQNRCWTFTQAHYAEGSFEMMSDANTTYSATSFGFGYGECTTSESDTSKIATTNATSLTVGSYAAIKFSYAVPANSTLNVNSKGAKPIYYKNTAITDNIIKAGDTVTFIYDGTNYQLVSIDKSYNLSDFNVTASATELNYTDGVTSNIQTQLNDKASIANENTFANKNTFSRTFTQGTNQLIMNNSYWDIFTCVGTNDPDTYTALSKGYVRNEAKQSDGSLDWVRYGTTEILYGKDNSSGTTTVECTLNFPTTSCSGTIALAPTIVTGTLTAGSTSITLSNSAITTSSVLDVYTNTYGVYPKTMTASAGSVTMTFKAQESDLAIRVEVR